MSGDVVSSHRAWQAAPLMIFGFCIARRKKRTAGTLRATSAAFAAVTSSRSLQRSRTLV
jgi:hypothetical protein